MQSCVRFVLREQEGALNVGYVCINSKAIIVSIAIERNSIFNWNHVRVRRIHVIGCCTLNIIRLLITSCKTCMYVPPISLHRLIVLTNYYANTYGMIVIL